MNNPQRNVWPNLLLHLSERSALWIDCVFLAGLTAQASAERSFRGVEGVSKRFTETGKWDDPWFVRLHPLKKLLWLYICDKCDASGVIDFCPEVAAVPCHDDRLTSDSIAVFGDRVQKLPNGKWLIVKFLPFQVGHVDANCPAHKPIIRLIHQNGISSQYPINTLPNRVLNREQEKEKNKEKDKEEGYKGRPITSRPLTKYGYPLPERCSIRQSDGAVLDSAGRTMDINDVRKAAAKMPTHTGV